ncbi:hypothetical protein Mapa_007158 [Marchantia paleacea]|nr:hypothetical protein Mapa_007158 [Marchantia paleacea]
MPRHAFPARAAGGIHPNFLGDPQSARVARDAADESRPGEERERVSIGRVVVDDRGEIHNRRLHVPIQGSHLEEPAALLFLAQFGRPPGRWPPGAEHGARGLHELRNHLDADDVVELDLRPLGQADHFIDEARGRVHERQEVGRIEGGVEGESGDFSGQHVGEQCQVEGDDQLVLHVREQAKVHGLNLGAQQHSVSSTQLERGPIDVQHCHKVARASDLEPLPATILCYGARILLHYLASPTSSGTLLRAIPSFCCGPRGSTHAQAQAQSQSQTEYHPYRPSAILHCSSHVDAFPCMNDPHLLHHSDHLWLALFLTSVSENSPRFDTRALIISLADPTRPRLLEPPTKLERHRSEYYSSISSTLDTKSQCSSALSSLLWL